MGGRPCHRGVNMGGRPCHRGVNIGGGPKVEARSPTQIQAQNCQNRGPGPSLAQIQAPNCQSRGPKPCPKLGPKRPK